MELIGTTALVVIDIQKGETMGQEACGIPIMDGGEERQARSLEIVKAAREAGIPPIFIQEVHKRTLIDFGRELDGSETIHGLEGDEATELAEGFEPLPDEYLIRKRRYSAFFATELELVLKAYKADTLVLIGALTDVCVHYTFADAHQHDYHLRVVTDCVGGSSFEAHQASLNAMEYLQRDALVTSDETLAAFAAYSGKQVATA
ncbi:MAG: cysteine hydrolase [Solirubrobacteraceae bacterium]|nr:cysteine hydrolase [Solirubrobacteraceae bacterium]